MKPRLLDLFCCAGGAGMGYQRAGFEVIGVDINPQPRYPFEFHQGDALAYLAEHGHEFDAIHGSPPCHDHSALRHTMAGGLHGTAWLLDATRNHLRGFGLPYVIENVPGAPMDSPITLCGSMFGLGAHCGDEYRQLRRHRQFESNVALVAPSCSHEGRAVGVYGGGRTKRLPGGGRGGYQGLKSERVEAMGIDWMTQAELSQAVPPVYTEFIGHQLRVQMMLAVAA